MKGRAIKAINRSGMLLVFPIANKRDPKSIWYELFPRTKMRWEWDNEGDSRVADLWHLREELSRSDKVIYAKWYQGRATFFSRPLFVAVLAHLRSLPGYEKGLGAESRQLLRLLEESSPLSTKELKSGASMKGKFFETTYHSALKQLWNRLLIVGYGEKDDGAFPSLQIGATRHLFEELWLESARLDEKNITSRMGLLSTENPLFLKYLSRISRTLQPVSSQA